MATDVGGLNEYFEPGERGYLVAPEDPEAIATAVIEHFKSNALDRMQMHISNYRKRFSWKKLAELIQAL